MYSDILARLTSIELQPLRVFAWQDNLHVLWIGRLRSPARPAACQAIHPGARKSMLPRGLLCKDTYCVPVMAKLVY